MYRDEFIQAIHEKRKIIVRFHSEKDGKILTRKCAPMDIGPSRMAKHNKSYYHVWDYDSDSGPHTLPLKPKNIKSIDVLEEGFNPADFVNWTPRWHITRDWGRYS